MREQKLKNDFKLCYNKKKYFPCHTFQCNIDSSCECLSFVIMTLNYLTNVHIRVATPKTYKML